MSPSSSSFLSLLSLFVADIMPCRPPSWVVDIRSSSRELLHTKSGPQPHLPKFLEFASLPKLLFSFSNNPVIVQYTNLSWVNKSTHFSYIIHVNQRFTITHALFWSRRTPWSTHRVIHTCTYGVRGLHPSEARPRRGGGLHPPHVIKINKCGKPTNDNDFRGILVNMTVSHTISLVSVVLFQILLNMYLHMQMYVHVFPNVGND